MRGIAETTGACRICLGLIILQFRRLCIGRLHFASQDKGDHVTVAGGTHPSHEVVITCMGLRKRRARGRSCEHVLEPLLRLCRTTTHAAPTPLGPHESWHSVPHGSLLSGKHPYCIVVPALRFRFAVTNCVSDFLNFGAGRNSEHTGVISP